MYTFIAILVLLLSYFISQRKNEYRKYLIYTTAFISCAYILWRITTIPVNNGFISFILGIVLFLAELIGLISFIDFIFLFTRKYELKKKTLEDYDFGQIPSIDVLICTYNEPLNLLKKTIIGCVNLEYPLDKINIYVCDDGKRDTLKQLCSKYQVNYITRNNNEGAKAGNINNALKQTNGDLFTVLDADMIPKKEFLLKTVGYFSNDNLAFVQVPQVYYNKDPYQHNLKKNISNEQDFFMRDVQEARASINAVLHVGTNALFRRSFVNEIGGYPTCSITEDMAIGMLLQSKGYDSILVNEELVLGLSATTFPELVKQRDRWCRGNLQVLKHFNPISTKGLTLGQKIAYLDGAIYWFSNLQKIIYLLCPIVFLLTQKLIIDCEIKELFSMYVPYILGQIIIFNVLSPGSRKLRWAHYYEVAMAPHLTLSIIKELLGLKINFNVTSKDNNQYKKQLYFKVMLPHIIIVILTLIAWIISTKLFISYQIDSGAYILNMIWSIYNLLGLLVCICISYQQPVYPDRVKVKDHITVKCKMDSITFNASILDISESGIALIINKKDIIKNEISNNIMTLIINNIAIPCEIVKLEDNVLKLRYCNANAEQMKIIMDIFIKNMQPYYNVNKKQHYKIEAKKETSPI